MVAIERKYSEMRYFRVSRRLEEKRISLRFGSQFQSDLPKKLLTSKVENV